MIELNLQEMESISGGAASRECIKAQKLQTQVMISCVEYAEWMTEEEILRAFEVAAAEVRKYC